MKRIVWITAALACFVAGTAVAQGQGQGMKAGGMKMAGEKETAVTTVQGEIVDMGCYLGHGAKGEGHKACATKCIAGGMPMGLLTQDGTLYLLTMSHENGDPFNSAKQMAADQVKITGPMHERDGVKSIEVTSIEPVGKAAAAKS